MRLFDHLPWTEDDDLDEGHMSLLQEKIYRYLDFIESGQINETHPPAPGTTLRLEIVAKYEMSAEAEVLFNKIRNYVSELGFKLVFRHFPTE